MKQIIIIFSFLTTIFSCSSKMNMSRDNSFENIYQSSTSGKSKLGYDLIQTNEAYLSLIERLNLEQVENEDLINVDFEDKNVIVIYLGEKNTGGYSIKIEELVWKQNLLLIKTEQIKPKKEDMVTMVITQSYCIATIPKIDLKENKIEIK